MFTNERFLAACFSVHKDSNTKMLKVSSIVLKVSAWVRVEVHFIVKTTCSGISVLAALVYKVPLLYFMLYGFHYYLVCSQTFSPSAMRFCLEYESKKCPDYMLSSSSLLILHSPASSLF